VGMAFGQLMLGAGAWGTSTGLGLNVESTQPVAQMFFATAHVSVGALILATCTLLTVQTYRLLTPGSDRQDGQRMRERSARSDASTSRPSVSALESRELWAQRVNV
jgi:hypothetical protein